MPISFLVILHLQDYSKDLSRIHLCDHIRYKQGSPT